MKTLLIALLTTLLPSAWTEAQAAPRIVLITSVEFDHNLPDMPDIHRYAANMLPKIERIFRHELSPEGDLGNLARGLEVRVVHNATAERVSQILQMPDNLAVIYIGHAMFAQAGTTSMGMFRLTDAHFNSIEPAFTRIHPNLRYLNWVGCMTSDIQKFFAKTHYREAIENGLVIEGAKGLEDAKAGLYTALKGVKGVIIEHFKRTERGEALKKCMTARGILVKLTRTFKQAGEHDALMVLRGDDHLVGVFPATEKDSVLREQTLTAWLDLADLPTRAAQLKLVVDTGASALGDRAKLELGTLDIHANMLEGHAGTGPQWKLATYADGRPMGVTQQIYRYQGKLPTADEWSYLAHEYDPYVCAEMPGLKIPERVRDWRAAGDIKF